MNKSARTVSNELCKKYKIAKGGMIKLCHSIEDKLKTKTVQYIHKRITPSQRWLTGKKLDIENDNDDEYKSDCDNEKTQQKNQMISTIIWDGTITKLEDCDVDQLIYMLESYIIDSTGNNLIIENKNKILSYIKENQIDGKTIKNDISRKEFGKSVANYVDNMKVNGPSVKLWRTIISCKLDDIPINKKKQKISIDEFDTLSALHEADEHHDIVIPYSLKECSVDVLIYLIESYALPKINNSILNQNIDTIISYFKEHHIDGNKILNTQRKTFSKSIATYSNNKKLLGYSIKLWKEIINFPFDKILDNYNKQDDVLKQQRDENNNKEKKKYLKLLEKYEAECNKELITIEKQYNQDITNMEMKTKQKLHQITTIKLDQIKSNQSDKNNKSKKQYDKHQSKAMQEYIKPKYKLDKDKQIKLNNHKNADLINQITKEFSQRIKDIMGDQKDMTGTLVITLDYNKTPKNKFTYKFDQIKPIFNPKLANKKRPSIQLQPSKEHIIVPSLASAGRATSIPQLYSDSDTGCDEKQNVQGNIDTSRYILWIASDIAKWIISINPKEFKIYLKSLESELTHNNINGYNLHKKINIKKKVKTILGIKKVGHKSTIFEEIEKLKLIGINYKAWTTEDVATFVISINPQKFQKFQNKIRKILKEQDVSGETLNELECDDIEDWGLGDQDDQDDCDMIYKIITDLIRNPLNNSNQINYNKSSITKTHSLSSMNNNDENLSYSTTIFGGSNLAQIIANAFIKYIDTKYATFKTICDQSGELLYKQTNKKEQLIFIQHNYQIEDVKFKPKEIKSPRIKSKSPRSPRKSKSPTKLKSSKLRCKQKIYCNQIENIDNCLVIFCGISKYQKPNKNINNIDIERYNYENTFKNQYNYEFICNIYTKKQKPKDIKDFFSKKRLMLMDKNNNIKYNGLIVIISSHGNSEYVLCSNNQKLRIKEIRSLFGVSLNKQLINLPKIFLIHTKR